MLLCFTAQVCARQLKEVYMFEAVYQPESFPWIKVEGVNDLPARITAEQVEPGTWVRVTTKFAGVFYLRRLVGTSLSAVLYDKTGGKEVAMLPIYEVGQGGMFIHEVGGDEIIDLATYNPHPT
jgi:hypothetical protein